MSDSGFASPPPHPRFSYADKRVVRSFLKLISNHISEQEPGTLQFNLSLETFEPYHVNNQVVRDLLNDVVKSFGGSVFTPRIRRGEPLEFSNEGIYLENVKTIPESIMDALDTMDENIQADMTHQCFLDIAKASKRSNESKFLLQFVTQLGMEIGPDSSQSLQVFKALLAMYQGVLRVLAIVVDLHNIKARWSDVFRSAIHLARTNVPTEVLLSVCLLYTSPSPRD